MQNDPLLLRKLLCPCRPREDLTVLRSLLLRSQPRLGLLRAPPPAHYARAAPEVDRPSPQREGSSLAELLQAARAEEGAVDLAWAPHLCEAP